MMLENLPEDIRKAIGHFASEASQMYPKSRILLFGSYARGNYNSQSDIDIALFLPERFRQTERRDIFRGLCRIVRELCYDIQPQIFFEEDYQNPLGITEEIVENGIDISEAFRHTEG